MINVHELNEYVQYTLSRVVRDYPVSWLNRLVAPMTAIEARTAVMSIPLS
jgi:hypothetical protein